MASSNSQYSYANLVKSSAASLHGSSLLSADVDQLLGVGAEAASLLRDDLRIQSIYDLATSQVFCGALHLVDPHGTLEVEVARRGLVPADVQSAVDPRDRGAAVEVGDQPLSRLRFRSKETADRVKRTLGVETVRDVALWSPFHVARAILKKTYGGDDSDLPHVAQPDPEMPAELVPVTGTFPTQQAYFSSLHIVDSDLTDDEILASAAPKPAAPPPAQAPAAAPAAGQQQEAGESGDVLRVVMTSLSDKGQVDLMQTALRSGGFTKPAVGVIVTSEQSWYSQGATLGQLLHSLPLAPGESTRVAVTSLRKLDRGKRKEAVDQTEDSTAGTAASHLLTEITDAVARETQQGYSKATTSSDATQKGSSRGGFSILAPLALFMPGHSGSSSSNSSLATSYNRTSGSRNLSGRVNQNITTTTHQQASSVRSRSSAVVKETLEGEKEGITTRVVTNYNHMHALSIQYWEVVQSYRVVTRATDYERCIFVPFKPFDFRDFRVIRRFRSILERAALTEAVGKKMRELKATEENWLDHSQTVASITENRTNRNLFTLTSPDAKLTKISYKGPSGMSSIRVYLRAGGYQEWWCGNQSSGEKTYDVTAASISGLRANPSSWGSGSCTITLEFQAAGKPITFAYTTWQNHWDDCGRWNDWWLLNISHSVIEAADADAIRHLNENSIHYSQAIWSSLDEAAWMRALASLKFRGEPVGATLVPAPVMMVANYMAFRWAFGDPAKKLDFLLETKLLRKDFRRWMARKGYTEINDAVKAAYLREHVDVQGDEGKKEIVIPIPTGGVFTEAVLGRCNSAEKLDLTRFWNWKDSPIPFVPPEIDPVKAGQRGSKELFADLKASGLSPQAIHLHTQAPTAGKAAAQGGGTQAALAALAASTMFRDMSNAPATAALAGQALQSAQAGATEAGRETGERMAMWANAVKGIVGSVMGSVGTQSLTNAGAAMNVAQQADTAAPAAGAAGAGTGTAAGAGTGAAASTGAAAAGTAAPANAKEEVLRRILGQWKSVTAAGKAQPATKDAGTSTDGK